MWREDIVENKIYYLQFCQSNEGRRYCEFREKNETKSKYCIFESNAVPNNILIERNRNKLQSECKINNGSGFIFGGHSEWYTENEAESLKNYDLGKTQVISWETEKEPCFAPK